MKLIESLCSFAILLSAGLAPLVHATPVSNLDDDPLAAAKTFNLGAGGYVHVADDGVLRHWHPKLGVLNYHKLSPEGIKDATSAYRSKLNHTEAVHLDDVFKGVDGRKVSDWQAKNPDPSLWPKAYHESRKKTWHQFEEEEKQWKESRADLQAKGNSAKTPNPTLRERTPPLFKRYYCPPLLDCPLSPIYGTAVCLEAGCSICVIIDAFLVAYCV